MKHFLTALLCLAVLWHSAGAEAKPSQPPTAQQQKAEQTSPQAQKAHWGTILVAFGTTVPQSKVALDAIGAAYAKRGEPVLWAYTSDIIRRKLDKRGEKTLSVFAAMNKAAEMGISHLRIQSLHVGVAEEFHQLERMVVRNLMAHPNRFTSVMLGHPLMESEQDMNEVVQAVLAEFPKERKKDEAIVLMGHGNDRGPGDLMLYAVGKAFQGRDDLVFVAAVEGSSTFDKVLEQLKARKVKKVWLQPFMIVAGEHARNDMAGPDADSWASQLKAAGIEAVPHMRGLGELQGVQAVFLRHTEASTDDMARSKKSDK